MEVLWLCLAATGAISYLLLDGYRLGVGSLLLALTRDDAEKCEVWRTLAPAWSGREILLGTAVACLWWGAPSWATAGGSLFASCAVTAVWLLVARGVLAEIRARVASARTSRFVDSAWMTLNIGFLAAMGTGLGSLLDRSSWFLVLAAMVSVLALMLHGATAAEVRLPGFVRSLTDTLWPPCALAGVLLIIVHAQLLPQFLSRPAWLIVPTLAVAAFMAIRLLSGPKLERLRYGASMAFLILSVVTLTIAVHPGLADVPVTSPATLGAEFLIPVLMLTLTSTAGYFKAKPQM